MSKGRRLALAVAFATTAFAVAAVPAFAQLPTESPLQRYTIGDLPLEGGGTIRDFEIAYVTHGKLNAARNNAVLMVTAISGNHRRLDFLIGPGKALDTDRYFIVATNAIGNGLTTSPSNSRTQKGPDFPPFLIRDMVESQRRLMVDHLKIEKVVTVIGASMGGMQVLQWGVSHPDYMQSLVALVPLARSPAWTVALNEATRMAFRTDPAFANGRYTEQPEAGWRMRAMVLNVLGVRSPESLKGQFPNALDVIPWTKTVGDAVYGSKFDANDWIAQSHAYDRHDIGTTPGRNFGGDHTRALAAIKARTLLMTGVVDLYNPVEETKEAARYIPDVRFIEMASVHGHAAGGPFKAADVEAMNRGVRDFLDVVTDGGRRLQ